MNEHVYKLVEVVGSSSEGSDAAVRNAIAQVTRNEPHANWFEVLESRGHIVNGGIAHFQVTVRVGCRIEQ